MCQTGNCYCCLFVLYKSLYSRSVKPLLSVMQMTLCGEGSTNVDCSRNAAKCEVCAIMACAHSGPIYLAFLFQRLAAHWAGER